MCSAESLREFISGRLTAAAGEIFTMFEQTIAQYEDEIDRLRRHTHTHDDLQEAVSPEETLWDQQEGEAAPVQVKQEPQAYAAGENLRTSTFHFGHQDVPAEEKPLEWTAREPRDPGSTGSTQLEIHNRWNQDTETRSFSRPASPDRQTSGFPGKAVNPSSSPKKNPSCDICGKSFSQTRFLKDHIRTHTGERPHSCQICWKSFSLKRSLKLHLRTHAGVRHHSCQTCGKSFIEKRNLTVHMRTHTGEKPHSCQTCGKSFNEKSNLMVHRRTHTGEKPHSCQTCGKGFSSKQSLEFHIKTHTGEKPHSCQICGKGFIQKAKLNCHLKVHR